MYSYHFWGVYHLLSIPQKEKTTNNQMVFRDLPCKPQALYSRSLATLLPGQRLDDSIIYYLLKLYNHDTGSRYMLVDSEIHRDAWIRKWNEVMHNGIDIIFPMNVNNNHWMLVYM